MGQRKLSFIPVRDSRTEQDREENRHRLSLRWCRVKALSRTLLHVEGNKPESVTPSQPARPHSCWKKVHELSRSRIREETHSPQEIKHKIGSKAKTLKYQNLYEF